ncbi:MAG: hypothetical protein HRF49_01075 [bacterium]
MTRPASPVFLFTLSSFLFALLSTSPALAQPSVTISPASAAAVEVKPRQMATVAFSVENRGGAASSVALVAEAPDGWGAVVTPETAELGPGGRATAFVTLSVPGDAAAGEYAVALSGGGGRGEARVRVAVAMEIALSLLNSPGDARAGGTLVFEWNAVNRGNAAADVKFSAETSPDWKTSADPAGASLAPGEKALVSVTVAAPKELESVESLRVTLHARHEGYEAKSTATARVAPSGAAVGSLYATLDGSLTARGDWRGGGESGDDAGAQSALELASEIGDGRFASLGVTAPLTDGEGGAAFSEESRIALAYEDARRGWIALGDQSFGDVSPLLGQNVTGRGMDLLLRSGDFFTRVFAAESRGSAVRKRTEGAQVGYAWGGGGKENGKNGAGIMARGRRGGGTRDQSVIRITALRENEYAPASLPGLTTADFAAYSVFASAAPWDGFLFEGEYASSDAGDAGESGAGGGDAYRLSARFESGILLAGGEVLRADPRFGGGYRDVELSRVNLSLRPADRLTVFGNFSSTKRNLDLDPERDARLDETLSYGATLALTDSLRLRYQRRESDSSDRQGGEDISADSSDEYEISQSFKNGRISLAFQERERDDLQADETETSRLLRLSGSARLNGSASLNAGFTRERRRDAEGTSTTYTQSQLGLDFRMSETLDAALGFQRTEGTSRGRTDWYTGSLSWQLPGGRKFNLRLRHSDGQSGGDSEIAVELSIPASFPLKMFPRKGRVSGRVFLSHEPQTGVAGVRLKIGSAEAVSDADGAFAFAALPPGAASLEIDAASLGVGMACAVTLPLELIVEPGAAIAVEIPVVRSVSLGGKVTLETVEPGKPVRISPMAEAIVVIEGPSGKAYRITDNAGRFIATGLAPGDYVVSIWAADLPKFHEASPAAVEIELAPGETKMDIEFAVRPVKREVEITAFG